MKKKSSTMTAWTREEFLSRDGGSGGQHQPEFSICTMSVFTPPQGQRNINFKEKLQHKNKVRPPIHSLACVCIEFVSTDMRLMAERTEELVGNTSNRKPPPAGGANDLLGKVTDIFVGPGCTTSLKCHRVFSPESQIEFSVTWHR